MSIPHRQGTTNVQNSSDYREYPVVSIPHRQDTTFEDALQKCGIIKNVSIPHRQGTTECNSGNRTLQSGREVSIPHRQGTTRGLLCKIKKFSERKCQFLIGKVQLMNTNTNLAGQEKCQFLIGKVQHRKDLEEVMNLMCQFLIGKVQQVAIRCGEHAFTRLVSIPHRQGTTRKCKRFRHSQIMCQFLIGKVQQRRNLYRHRN